MYIYIHIYSMYICVYMYIRTYVYTYVAFFTHFLSRVRLLHPIRASSGGGEPDNSGPCVPRHHRPAHPLSHRPPSRPTWTEVRVHRGFLFARAMACRFRFFRAADRASFHPVLNQGRLKEKKDKKEILSSISVICSCLQCLSCDPSEVRLPRRI